MRAQEEGNLRSARDGELRPRGIDPVGPVLPTDATGRDTLPLRGSDGAPGVVGAQDDGVLVSLKLLNVQLQLAAADTRHALVCEDVENISVDNIDAAYSSDACATIRLTDVKGAFIRGCRPQAGTDIFLKMEGDASEGVVLVANDFSHTSKVAEMARDVPKTALFQLANHTAEKP